MQPSRDGSRSLARRVVFAGLLGAALTASIVSVHAVRAGDRAGEISGPSYIKGYERPSTAVEVMLASGDGMAYMQVAIDPLVRDPGAYPDLQEASYRASRPLLPLLTRFLGFGHLGAMRAAIVVWMVIGGGLAAAGAALLLADRGATPWLGALVPALPGSVAAVSRLGPEPLALGLVLFGIAAWARRKDGVAVLLFALAVLSRETLILVPIALGLRSLVRRDYGRGAALAAAAVPYLAWVIALRVLVGTWAVGYASFTLPFVGALDASLEWFPPAELLTPYLYTLAMIATAVKRRIIDPLAAVVLVHGVFLVMLAEPMLANWRDWTRIVLPLHAAAFILACAGSARARSAGVRAGAHATPGPAIP